MLKKNVLSLIIALFLFPIAQGYAFDEEDFETLVYEEPTVAAYSQLYWALGRFPDFTDKDVDNYMLINECDIYNNYSNHEFEWDNIRKSSKVFLKSNLKNFPLRFEFVQKVNLTKYDIEKQEFMVRADYNIVGMRRFFIAAKDYYDEICGVSREIPGYPKTVMLELSKPFTFNKLKMDKDSANAFITSRLDRAKSKLTERQTFVNTYAHRDVYLVMNIKFFASKGTELDRDQGYIAHLLGILESYEVFGDRERKELIYAEDYRNSRKASDIAKRERLIAEERLILEAVAERRKALKAKEEDKS